VDVKIRRYRIW